MVLGVTGNIASGKSTISRELARRGAIVLDADQLARELVAPGTPVLARLVEAFGSEILGENGQLKRKRLGQMIFGNSSLREKLNRILHPAIAELSTRRLRELRQRTDVPLVVYEAPLLFEVGAESRVDKILVVKIEPEEQLKRLLARDGAGEADAQRRIAAQMSQQKKLERADFVIDNSGSLAETLQQVDDLWEQLLLIEV